MPDILTIALYIFLVIFFITAILTLLALIGKVKMQQNYLKQLFRLLLLQVIAVVITFVSNNILKEKPVVISNQMLLEKQGLWDWNLPENSWRTKFTFSDRNDSLQLSGITYQRSEGIDIPIIEWKSIEPVSIQSAGASLKFKSKMKWLKDVLRFQPNMANEIDKWREGITILNLEEALYGSFNPDGGGAAWGMGLIHAR